MNRRSAIALLSFVFVLTLVLAGQCMAQAAPDAPAASADRKMPQPTMRNPKLYDPDVVASQEIAKELGEAAKTHRRVILVFGANWCYDCHVLDAAFHQPDVAPTVEKNFIVIHVDIGKDGKKNNDLAKKYNIPLKKGIPALAVLESDGKLLYSQQNGEFEAARSMDPAQITAFLNKWKKG